MTTFTDEIQTQINALPGVMSCSVWSKGANPRLYIRLSKHNGGHAWNRGEGCLGLYVHFVDGRARLVEGTWAGAATRNRHDDLGTFDAIIGVFKAARLAAAEPRRVSGL